MVEALGSYSNHTLFGVIAEGVSGLLSSLNALVNRVALGILIQIVISIPLFYLHHNLFALGFVIGFIFDRQVNTVVEKVDEVYSAHRTLLEKSLFFGGGGFLAILTMPTSMVIATLYYSAQWGALLYQSSLARYRPPHAEMNDQEGIDLEEVQIDDGEEMNIESIDFKETELLPPKE